MTVIAWDGKILASDSLMTSGNTKSLTQKLFEHNGELIGLAGSASRSRELLSWYIAGADPLTFPEWNRNADAACGQLLVIRKDGRACQYITGPWPVYFDQPIAAIGCGDESAYVAMACGLDAAQAVKMVIRFNSGCGGDVQTLRLPSLPM